MRKTVNNLLDGVWGWGGFISMAGFVRKSERNNGENGSSEGGNLVVMNMF